MGAIVVKLTNDPTELMQRYKDAINHLKQEIPKVLKMLEQERNKTSWDLQPWHKKIFRKNPFE